MPKIGWDIRLSFIVNIIEHKDLYLSEININISKLILRLTVYFFLVSNLGCGWEGYLCGACVRKLDTLCCNFYITYYFRWLTCAQLEQVRPARKI